MIPTAYEYLLRRWSGMIAKGSDLLLGQDEPPNPVLMAYTIPYMSTRCSPKIHGLFVVNESCRQPLAIHSLWFSIIGCKR